MILHSGNHRTVDLRGTRDERCARCEAIVPSGKLCRNHCTHLITSMEWSDPTRPRPICGIHYALLQRNPRRLRIE